MENTIERLKDKQAIVEHPKKSDLIVIFINPRNFKKNPKGNWLFESDSLITFSPMWVGSNKVELKVIKNPGDALRDVIRHPDDFTPLDEWLKIVQNGRECFRRIFE